MEVEKGQYYVHNGELWLRHDDSGNLLPTYNAFTPDNKSAHYGTLLFEGERVNLDANGKAHLFREEEHRARLGHGVELLDMGIKEAVVYGKEDAILTMDDFLQQAKDLVSLNFPNRDKVYVRRAVGRGAGLGVNPQGSTVEYMIMTEIWPEYLSGDAMFISSIVRPSAQSPLVVFDPHLKLSAHYGYASMAKYEAQSINTSPPPVEPLMLNAYGNVAEASGANIFVLYGSRISTPKLSDGVLDGITRRTILESGTEAHEFSFGLDYLLKSDGVFLTGSATNVKPIRAFYIEKSFAEALEAMQMLDKNLLEKARKNPIAAKVGYKFSKRDITLLKFQAGTEAGERKIAEIAEWYMGVIYNRNPKFSNWLTLVEPTLSRWAKEQMKNAWEKAGLKPPAHLLNGQGMKKRVLHRSR